MWKLLIPTATFKLCHYFIQQITSHLVLRIFREERVQKEVGIYLYMCTILVSGSEVALNKPLIIPVC